jgi:hypothetical protein
MKIWSTPHSDMGRPVNYNGPKVIALFRAQGVAPRHGDMSSAAGYMLETPSIRWYFAGSENPSGADNQQERPIR